MSDKNFPESKGTSVSLIQEIMKLNNSDFVEVVSVIDNERAQRAETILKDAAKQAALLSHKHHQTYSKRSAKKSPKFINQQTGDTWTGQGRAPKWITEHEQKGGSREDFLIK